MRTYFNKIIANAKIVGPAFIAFCKSTYALIKAVVILSFSIIGFYALAVHTMLIYIFDKINKQVSKVNLNPKVMAYITEAILVAVLMFGFILPHFSDAGHDTNPKATTVSETETEEDSEVDETQLVAEVEAAAKEDVHLLRGVDVSGYQDTTEIWEKEDPDFVIVKTGEGTGCDSKTAQMHLDRAEELNKLVGTYHLIRPDLHSSDESAIEEAQYYYDRLIELGWDHNWLLACDLEDSFALSTQKETARYCKSFLDEVYRLTDVKPLIYINQSNVANAAWKTIASDYGLWVAGYPKTQNTERWNNVKENRIAFAYTKGVWGEVAIWQYSTLGNLDRDLAYMTPEAWGKFANPTAQ